LFSGLNCSGSNTNGGAEKRNFFLVTLYFPDKIDQSALDLDFLSGVLKRLHIPDQHLHQFRICSQLFRMDIRLNAPLGRAATVRILLDEKIALRFHVFSPCFTDIFTINYREKAGKK